MRFDFDWSHINLFVAVATTGSLSAASRITSTSQPTIGRAISALEADLGVSLFARHPRGLSLTEQGEELLVHANRMVEAAASFSLAAAGRSNQLEGTVRITASQIVATYILPPILACIRRAEPKIQIDVVSTNNVENLLLREADIAIRMVRPQQQDLISKRVAEMPLGIYASHAYLAERPAPYSLEELEMHTVIGYDRSTLIIDGAAELGVALDRDFFSVRCDDQVVVWKMLLAGLGLGFVSSWIVGSDNRVVRVLPSVKLAPLPLWLTSHSELNTSPRVRYVYDMLSEALTEYGVAHAKPCP